MASLSDGDIPETDGKQKYASGVVVTGSRHYTNQKRFDRTFTKYFTIRPSIIIAGGCSGVDQLAKKYAHKFRILYKEFPAKWDEEGKAAGPKRNERMLDWTLENCQCAAVIGFVAAGSKGTKQCLEAARSRERRDRLRGIFEVQVN